MNVYDENSSVNDPVVTLSELKSHGFTRADVAKHCPGYELEPLFGKEGGS